MIPTRVLNGIIYEFDTRPHGTWGYHGITPLIQKHGFTCSFTACLMVLDFYCCPFLGEQELRLFKFLDPSEDDGADENRVKAALKEFGMRRVRSHKNVDLDFLKSLNGPALTTVDKDDHWCVIHGVDGKDNVLTDGDWTRKWTDKKFKKTWGYKEVITCEP